MMASITGIATAADDLEWARSMFREALVLEVAGDWAAALAKFQEVAKARLTPQVRYHLARCKEHLGRHTEALGDYRVAEIEARTANLEETPEIERARQELEVRIPQLLLRVSGSSSITIELDGISLGPTALNRAMVVNPGWHRITVRHESGRSLDSFIEAEPARQLEVDLRESEQKLSLPVRVPPVAVPPSPAARKVPTWAYVSTAVGSAAVVSSAVLWVVRQQAIHDLDVACNPKCDESQRATLNRGQAASVAAPITLGVGVASLGLAAWGLFRSPDGTSSRGTRSANTVSGIVGTGIVGIEFQSNF
jgi:hypothetical protein